LQDAVISRLRTSKGEETIALQGELRMLEKFINLDKLRQIYKVELDALKQHGKEGDN
jgi:hypothetical protein